MTDKVRYRYVEEPFQKEEAQISRDLEIACLRSRIWDLSQEIKRIQKLPLMTTILRQIAVHPGEDGYDELPVNLDPVNWQGEIKWVNPKP